MSNLKKVQPGDTLKIPAQTFNTFIDAARDFRSRQQSTGGRGRPSFQQNGIVLVKNATGGHRERFNILDIEDSGGALITPDDNLEEFKNRVVFKASYSAGQDSRGRIAVLTEPVFMNGIARAVVAGVTPVKLYLTHAQHRYAIADNITRLKSGLLGPAEILWVDDGTGSIPEERWALVRLGNHLSVGGFWAKIEAEATGGDGEYDEWTEQSIDPSSGGWMDRYGGLNENAGSIFEVNQVEGIEAGAIVWVWNVLSQETIPACSRFCFDVSGLSTKGTHARQMQYWDPAAEQWKLTPESGSPPNNSVLVPTAAGFTWPTAEYDYQILQRKSDDTIGFDWLRFS